MTLFPRDLIPVLCCARGVPLVYGKYEVYECSFCTLYQTCFSLPFGQAVKLKILKLNSLHRDHTWINTSQPSSSPMIGVHQILALLIRSELYLSLPWPKLHMFPFCAKFLTPGVQCNLCRQSANILFFLVRDRWMSQNPTFSFPSKNISQQLSTKCQLHEAHSHQLIIYSGGEIIPSCSHSALWIYILNAF